MPRCVRLVVWLLLLNQLSKAINVPAFTSSSTAELGNSTDIVAEDVVEKATDRELTQDINITDAIEDSKPEATWKDIDWDIDRETYEDAFERLQSFIMTRRTILNKFPPHEVVYPQKDDGLWLKFTPFAVLSVDEVQQSVTISAYIRLKWRDVSLYWDPAEYHGISKFSIKSSQIWTPNIVLPLSNDRGLFLETPEYVRLYRSMDYNVGYKVPFQFTTLCELDLSSYPFDSQTCEIIFTELNGYTLFPMENKERDFRLTETLHISGEWEITSWQSEVLKSEEESVRFVIEIKRDSTYYVANVIIPLLLTSIMTMLVFGIPIEGGDKMSYLVSMFVSTSVFLGIINEETPRSIKQLPTVNIILIVVSSEIFVASVITVLVLHLYRKRRSSGEDQKVLPQKYVNNAEKTAGIDSNQNVEKSSKEMTSEQEFHLSIPSAHGYFPGQAAKHSLAQTETESVYPKSRESGDAGHASSWSSNHHSELRDVPEGQWLRESYLSWAWLEYRTLDMTFLALFLTANLAMVFYVIFYWS